MGDHPGAPCTGKQKLVLSNLCTLFRTPENHLPFTRNRNVLAINLPWTNIWQYHLIWTFFFTAFQCSVIGNSEISPIQNGIWKVGVVLNTVYNKTFKLKWYLNACLCLYLAVRNSSAASCKKGNHDELAIAKFTSTQFFKQGMGYAYHVYHVKIAYAW